MIRLFQTQPDPENNPGHFIYRVEDLSENWHAFRHDGGRWTVFTAGLGGFANEAQVLHAIRDAVSPEHKGEKLELYSGDTGWVISKNGSFVPIRTIVNHRIA